MASEDNKNKLKFYMGVSTMTTSEPIYTPWTYIMELGGWMGLFLGYSVIDILDILVEAAFAFNAYLF